MPEREAVAAGELGRFGRRAAELIDHLALGDGDRAERHRETDLLRHELEFDLAEADFARERMRAAVAALGRIAERQQETLVAARQILQAQVAPGREGEWRAGEIADRGVGFARRARLD